MYDQIAAYIRGFNEANDYAMPPAEKARLLRAIRAQVEMLNKQSRAKYHIHFKTSARKITLTLVRFI